MTKILPELLLISLLLTFHVLPISPFLFISIFLIFILVFFTIPHHLFILFIAPLEEFFKVLGFLLVGLSLLPGVVKCLTVALLPVILISILVSIELTTLSVEGVSPLLLILLPPLVLARATEILLSILGALPCTIVVSFDSFVSQHSICITNSFKLFLSFSGIFVRVILLGQLIICLFDVGLICCLGNTEGFVVILLLVELWKSGEISSVYRY